MHKPGTEASSCSLRPQDAAVGASWLPGLPEWHGETLSKNKTNKPPNKTNTQNKQTNPQNKTKSRDSEVSQWAKMCLSSSLCLGPVG